MVKGERREDARKRRYGKTVIDSWGSLSKACTRPILDGYRLMFKLYTLCGDGTHPLRLRGRG
jgi:hypothetical protein